MSNSSNPFGPVIFSYSRTQALADGVLVDLTQIETIRTAFKFPLACTDTVWAIIEEALTHDGQDIEGIGHDISTMATHAIRQMRGGDRLFFKVIIAGRTHAFKMLIGPGDTPAPVMTLMLPNED